MKPKITDKAFEFAMAIRAWLPTAPQQFRLYLAAAREDPMAVLRSPVLRIAGLVCAGIVLLLFASCLGNWAYPSKGMGTPARLATFQVRCENPQCKYVGTVRLDPEFRKWPTACPKCKKKTLLPWLLCRNPKCQKYGTPVVQPNGTLRCRSCGAPM
jgi:hypothetical protein